LVGDLGGHFGQVPCSTLETFERDAPDLLSQQPALQPLESAAQQSHLQSSQVQTPVSQQQPPSGQQVVQAHASEAEFVVRVVVKLAPKAKPTPTNKSKPIAAAIFMFKPYLY
jgi:hypothetical protein